MRVTALFYCVVVYPIPQLKTIILSQLLRVRKFLPVKKNYSLKRTFPYNFFVNGRRE